MGLDAKLHLGAPPMQQVAPSTLAMGLGAHLTVSGASDQSIPHRKTMTPGVQAYRGVGQKYPVPMAGGVPSIPASAVGRQSPGPASPSRLSQTGSMGRSGTASSLYSRGGTRRVSIHAPPPEMPRFGQEFALTSARSPSRQTTFAHLTKVSDEFSREQQQQQQPPEILDHFPAAPPSAPAGGGGGGGGVSFAPHTPVPRLPSYSNAGGGGGTISAQSSPRSPVSRIFVESTPRRHPLDAPVTPVSQRSRGVRPEPLPLTTTGGYSYRLFNAYPQPGVAEPCKTIESAAWAASPRGDQRLRHLRWLASASVDYSREVEPSVQEIALKRKVRKAEVQTYANFSEKMRKEAISVAKRALDADHLVIEAELADRLYTHFEERSGFHDEWRCLVGRTVDYARSHVRGPLHTHLYFTIGQLPFLVYKKPPRQPGQIDPFTQPKSPRSSRPNTGATAASLSRPATTTKGSGGLSGKATNRDGWPIDKLRDEAEELTPRSAVIAAMNKPPVMPQFPHGPPNENPLLDARA